MSVTSPRTISRGSGGTGRIGRLPNLRPFVVAGMAGIGDESGGGVDVRAWSWAIVVVAVGGLAACQSFDPAQLEPAKAPPPVTPVTLTAAQTDAVKAAVKTSLGNPRSLKFGASFLAASDASGQISVCGTVSGRSIPGPAGDKPFVGHFFDGRFIPDKIGGGDARSEDTYALCTQRGLSLPMAAPPAAPPPAAGTG